MSNIINAKDKRFYKVNVKYIQSQNINKPASEAPGKGGKAFAGARIFGSSCVAPPKFIPVLPS